MGHMQSVLKAQYYPTDRRICNYFAILHLPIEHKNKDLYRGYKNFNSSCEEVKNAIKEVEEYEEYMKTNVYKFKKDWHKIPSYSIYKFQKDIIEGNKNTNDEYEYDPYFIKTLWGEDYKSGKVLSIADLFAGKGEWLTTYGSYSKKYYDSLISTLGVELVKERSDCLKNNGVDYIFNSAYEDMDFGSKGLFSLFLFNPPYSTINGERTTKYYLKDIIEKEILIECNSFVDFVIREDDFIDCLDLLLDHFSIVEETLFKAPSDEYGKYKQVVFTARYKRKSKPMLDTRFLVEDRQELKKSLIEKINNLEEIDITKIPKDKLGICRTLTPLHFDKQMESLKMKSNNAKKISIKNDMTWRWFEELTKIDTETIGNLILPKPPKDGEIINIISSGLLNEQVDNHVVVGGIEQKTETFKAMVTDSNGKGSERIEVRKINKPFFNVLLPNGDIKKLMNKSIE